MSETTANDAAASFADRKVARAYSSKSGWSRKFRERRFERLARLIDTVIAEKGRCRIADIGGTHYYWDSAADFLASRPVEVTLINQTKAEARSGKFDTIVGDATDLSEFADNAFDLVHSNSVIEHVGDWKQMQAMAREVSRLAPAYYVQTPNFWFPIEPHFRFAFFHWLPEQVRMRLVMRWALGFAERKQTVEDAMARVQSARLLDKKQMRALFPDGQLETEFFCGLAKSFTAIRQR